MAFVRAVVATVRLCVGKHFLVVTSATLAFSVIFSEKIIGLASAAFARGFFFSAPGSWWWVP